MGKRWPRSPVNCKWESFQCPSYPTSTFYLPPLATRKGATFMLWTQWLLDWLDRGSPLHAQHINQVTASLVSWLLVLIIPEALMEGLTDPLLSVDIRYHQQSKTIDDSPSCCCSVFCHRVTKCHVCFSPKMWQDIWIEENMPTKLLHVSDMIK